MKNSITKIVIKESLPILLRNLFSLVVIIIGGLSIILIILGNSRDGVFLIAVLAINIILGIVQELRAKIALEKLQALARVKYQVTSSGQKSVVYSDEIMPGDIVELKLGDQCPVDGQIKYSNGCECNDALLTGESENISKSEGDTLLAGSIIVAGTVSIEAKKIEQQSYLAQMNKDLKKYQLSTSPIQSSILHFIQIMALALAVIAVIIIVETLLSGETILSGFTQIAAIAATIIAEGLLLASTAFFVYGSIRMATKKVLVQQINAIEKLGRMAIVCIDKTGTLTQNSPVFDEFIAYDSDSDKRLRQYTATYLTNESSQTATNNALGGCAGDARALKTSELLAFSSARKYSAFRIFGSSNFVVIGASENFIHKLGAEQQKWLNAKIQELSKSAKRVLFVARADSGKLDDISTIKGLELVGLVVLSNPLKASTASTISVLQNRGVQVVVISGDSQQTVLAIANLAKINHGKDVITGPMLDKINDAELAILLTHKPLFARILPAQKQRIVEAAQASGAIVAMIGDGANDALAIKKADIGIAMFDGAPATRQIADVVLINNSFSAIPKGIELSDSIITTLEMVACLFFTRVWSGILIIFGSLVLASDYPFSPRNITLLNIFIISFPLLLWLLQPRHRDRSVNELSFLQRTLPFSIMNALIIATFSLLSLILLKSLLLLDGTALNMGTLVIFMVMSIYSIAIIPDTIGADKSAAQQRIIYGSFVGIALVVSGLFMFPTLGSIFSIEPISLEVAGLALAISIFGMGAQYLAMRINLGNRLWLRLKNTSGKTS